MLPIRALGSSYIKAIPGFLIYPLFYIVLLLIIIQYARAAGVEKRLWGRPRHAILKQVLISLFFGVLGGFVGSLLLLGVGVALSGSWMLYVWVVALALAFVSARLMCFAYAGGIVALSSLLLGWPKLDISSLLALVALLHAVESLLMFMSGHLGAIPVNVKNSHGDIVGGFSLQKFWPVPLLALAIIPQLLPDGIGSIPMPDWWPLISPHTLTENFSFWMIPVVAGLGYGELAISTNPKKRARESAAKLAGYSLVLFFLAYLSTKSIFFLYLGALFAPIGHELLVWTTSRKEMAGRPLYGGSSVGLQLLDIMPQSPAARSGLAQGDIILSADGWPILTAGQLEAVLLQSQGQICLVTNRGLRYLSAPLTLRDSGVVPVPDEDTNIYLETRFHSPFDFIAKLIGR
ncbi:MAG: periplasmic protease [Bacillota bacterium]|nr:MAG: periplasmic protease [Bacillota bacterium]MBS3950560.1 PDZ domain-containing protein [Peptococcaceae bacterium]